jgi:hypothetical protein
MFHAAERFARMRPQTRVGEPRQRHGATCAEPEAAYCAEPEPAVTRWRRDAALFEAGSSPMIGARSAALARAGAAMGQAICSAGLNSLMISN